MKEKIAALMLAGAALGGCVPREAAAPAARPLPFPAEGPARPISGLESVIGRNARALTAQFGTPDLDIREGNARKLQFLGPACVLDVYLYPSRAGAEPVATYIDARLPDGRDMDKASCIAAISRR